MPTDPKAADRPSLPRAEYVAAAPDILLIRDLLAGTRRMHERYQAYIAKYAAEKPQAYKRRATAAKVYGGLGRTLSASVGMLYAKPPQRGDGWTDEIQGHWHNIDGKGTSGDVFTKSTSEDAIADGFTAVLVDFTPPPTDVVVHGGNEHALNLRPLWASYARANILSWRTKVINNVETLSQVVLREAAHTDDGRFGVLEKIQYRVCFLAFQRDPDGPAAADPQWIAQWELLEEQKQADGSVVVVRVDAGIFRGGGIAGTPFNEIPLAVLYAGRSDATLCAHPPLLDVAWANLEHWQIATDLRYYEKQCCFPQPTIAGELAKGRNGEQLPFMIGPGVLVNVTAGSTYEIKELEGKSLAQLRESLQVVKDEIAELGMSFLAKKTRGVETAEAKRLDATAENSTLATAAQGIQDGINQAFVFHAQYLGIPKEQAPTLAINTDFDQIAMDPQTMVAYISAVRDAGLPVRLLLDAWQAGGRIQADVDLDALEAEMVANAEAAAAQKAAELAQQKDAQQNDLKSKAA